MSDERLDGRFFICDYGIFSNYLCSVFRTNYCEVYNMRDILIESIKEHEGYKGMQYICPAGYPTVGYGTRLPISEEEATVLLKMRLRDMIDELEDAKPFIRRLPDHKQEILFEMAYQMGVPNLLKFKRMWAALELMDYEAASREMLDSKWARKDSPNRAKKLAERMSI